MKPPFSKTFFCDYYQDQARDRLRFFCMHYVIVRLTKVMNNLVKDLKILNFSTSKLDPIFPKENFFEEYFIEEYFIRRALIVMKLLELKLLYLLKMCPIFFGSVHNLGQSDDNI